MSDEKLNIAVRFFGGADNYTGPLQEMLEFIGSEGPGEPALFSWVKNNTRAESDDGIRRRLRFIEAINLIDRSDEKYHLTDQGRSYLENKDSEYLYQQLSNNVRGFDTIFKTLAAGPKTDDELGKILKKRHPEFGWNSDSGPAQHRGWLQSLGYVKREGQTNELTESGRKIARKLKNPGSDDAGSTVNKPQVFLTPVNREGWLDDFKETVDEPVDLGPVADRPAALSDLDQPRIWGAHPGDRNDTFWEQMETGDIILFYSQRWLFAAARIEKTFRSSDASKYIWDSDDGGLIYTVEDYQRIALSRSTAWDWFEYGDEYAVQGLTRVSTDRLKALREDGVDLWERITEYTVDDSLEDILDGRVSRPKDSNPSNVSAYFILKTGGGGYEDKPRDEYHFKKGIPGSKQLRDAAGDAKFVYLEDREFYATGRIGEIHDEDRDGTKHYFATIEDYAEIEPVAFDSVRDDLEPDFPIQYGIIKISQQDYDRILRGEANPEFEPADAYDGITAATEDITTRLNRLDEDRTAWFTDQLTETVVRDWWTALRNFDPETVVSPTREVRFEQLRTLYESCETDLTTLAQRIKNGSLNQLSEPETLFTVLLRQLQSKYDLRENANQVKLYRILEAEYKTTQDDNPGTGNGSDPVDHPLLTHLDTLSAATPVRKFTAPPDYWLTALQYGTISFEPDHKDVWDAIEPGEIAILHARAEPGDDDLSSQPPGIIGVGILGEKSTKDERWWADEDPNDPWQPLVTFDRLFVTSNLAQLDIATPVADHTTDSFDAALDALTAGILEFETAETICTETNGRSFPAQGAHAVFRAENGTPDHDRPRALLETLADRLQEAGTVNGHVGFDGTLTTDSLTDLYFPGDEKADIVEQIEAALRTGKHIILTGPPGTGKTEIARRVCRHLADEYPYLYSDFQLTTATADWSTFDTVGGYMPENGAEDGEDLAFRPGVVLNRLKDPRTGRQENEPIIIDELNRADIDKAFGQLFTLLSGQSVQLPYTSDGEEIELLSADQVEHEPAPHQYVVPDSWRIFATMNTYDKTSLYEMSYAFMRRFAFIRVSAPEIPSSDAELVGLMREYAAAWEIDASQQTLTTVGRVWRAMNHAVEDRAIGPAIVMDILAYVTEQPKIPLEEKITRAVISYIFPQLEGVPKREQIVRKIAAVNMVDKAVLDDAAGEMLQVTISSDE